MAELLLVIPETYSGEGPFDAWATHFQNITALNSWLEEQQLQRLTVRLFGCVQIAFQNLLADARGSYLATKAALLERFNPESSSRGFYAAEFHTKQKQLQEAGDDAAGPVITARKVRTYRLKIPKSLAAEKPRVKMEFTSGTQGNDIGIV